VRGPLASTYTDEVEAAEAVRDLVSALDSVGIEIKLGQIPDEQRPRLSGLTPSQIATMKRHKLDIVRVLLARALVREAEQIRRMWVFPDQRHPSNGRRYGDLLFSARALLPPGYAWDDVTYEGPEGPTCWSHQLTYDRNGHQLEGISYDILEAEALLQEFKGDERVAAEA
jgi:hypothetical protein